MEIQGATQQSAETAMLQKSLTMTQELSGSLISGTLDRMNSGMVGMTPAMNADYATQKAILSSAYAEKGIGTRLDAIA